MDSMIFDLSSMAFGFLIVIIPYMIYKNRRR